MSADYLSAVEDFQAARRRAALEEIVGRLTGRPVDLLSYDEVRRKLKTGASEECGLQEIPVSAIVGSVGRYTDFTRSFLPRRTSDQERWARVEMATTDMAGLPPIEAYKIGESYFVKDGNHRVSVARRFGATHMEAYVTELQTPVPLRPDMSPDDLLLAAEKAEFLEQTRLTVLRPGADVTVTAPGQYRLLQEHIQVHRYYMGVYGSHDVSLADAVSHWYDAVYLPVVQAIRTRGILREFPGRTEADLYLWVSAHQAALRQELGWEVAPEAAAVDWTRQSASSPRRRVSRLRRRLVQAVLPDELTGGPAPGAWRREQPDGRPAGCLFADVLVPVDGTEAGWRALDQAMALLRCDQGRLLGLYVVPERGGSPDPASEAVQAEFGRRCAAAGVPGVLAVEAGPVAETICRRSPWADVIVLSLNHPPSAQPIARLRSGLHRLVRSCAVPVLAVPGAPSPLARPLLAYDGSPKGEEALFVATYLAGSWRAPLVVVTVGDGRRVTSGTADRARQYLTLHAVPAEFVEERGPVPEAILRTAQARQSDLVVMGGYGYGPLREAVLGSAVDRVLRGTTVPILICR